jgi:AcrR family transcriptional regulator
LTHCRRAWFDARVPPRAGPSVASTKEQIILTAERLFAARGLDGVSLREIGATAGNANHSAVRYHFGSKEKLVEAIFLYRLPHLEERRRILIARHRPADVRAWVEAYVLPILEQGEQRGSHYLGFVAALRGGALMERIPDDLRASLRQLRDAMDVLLAFIPEPLRGHRLMQAVTFAVHAGADRERAQAAGLDVLPFAVHVADLLDGLVGFLEAPVSPNALAALGDARPSWPAVSPVL